MKQLPHVRHTGYNPRSNVLVENISIENALDTFQDPMFWLKAEAL
jgi:hypothetical protein